MDETVVASMPKGLFGLTKESSCSMREDDDDARSYLIPSHDIVVFLTLHDGSARNWVRYHTWGRPQMMRSRCPLGWQMCENTRGRNVGWHEADQIQFGRELNIVPLPQSSGNNDLE